MWDARRHNVGISGHYQNIDDRPVSVVVRPSVCLCEINNARLFIGTHKGRYSMDIRQTETEKQYIKNRNIYTMWYEIGYNRCHVGMSCKRKICNLIHLSDLSLIIFRQPGDSPVPFGSAHLHLVGSRLASSYVFSKWRISMHSASLVKRRYIKYLALFIYFLLMTGSCPHGIRPNCTSLLLFDSTKHEEVKICRPG